MERQLENRFAYYRINNQIVFLQVKRGVVLNLEAATAIAADRMAFQQDDSYSVLFDLSNVFDSDKPGRDFLAHFGWLRTRRVGILAKPFKSYTIAKFYLLMHRPKVPTMLFMDPISVLQFLDDDEHNTS